MTDTLVASMERPSWDSYFLHVAEVVATRAACTRSQVGAVLVDFANHIIGTGYNGAPSGQRHCTDGGCPRGVLTPEDCAPGSSYENCVAIHAEVNALAHATSRYAAVLYVTRQPCDWCMKVIEAFGVPIVVFKQPDGSLGRITTSILDWDDLL